MRKISLAIAALAATTLAANAADLPARMPVKAMPPDPVMTWTGCYIGAGGGYGMWNQDHSTSDPTGTTPQTTVGGRGWFGTAQVGCDYQWNTNWLVGAFVDGDVSSLRGTLQDINATTALSGRERQTWGWAAGGRVGYLLYPQLLTYVSGGFTEAHFDQINLATFAGAAAGFYPSHNYQGWFLGTGYEYKLTWLPGLAWKTEYRFSDYGSDNLGRFNNAGALTTVSMNSHKYEQVIRSELVYRFSWWR